MERELLAQYPVYRLTLNDGRVFASRFMSSLVGHMRQVGVKINRTALHRALHRRCTKKAGDYRDMHIERVMLDELTTGGDVHIISP